MQKRWVIKKAADRDTVAKLIEEVDVSRPIANLLAHRGIKNFDQAKSFFRPSISDLHDPHQMKGMNEAVSRIENAFAGNENILIYGDYDVDGTTAVALMYEFLTKEYDQVGYYIPDRYKEGYGISMEGVDFAIANSFSLIIALDCGIKAIEQVAYAKENGIDFIVCDHHTPGKELPDAIILNPKQQDDIYPFKELSGCGVGFKLVQALNEKWDRSFEDIEYLLDLVVVSIGADIVSMTGENRILAHFGMKLLNSNPRIGFRKLLGLAKKTGELNVTDVVFILAPRINAAGRIESGNQAVQLLLAKNDEEVDQISTQINEHNETRKGLDKMITEEALSIIKEDEWFREAKSTVIFKEDWHKGVVGIVASRLTESYYRPTIVLTASNGKAVGSARSVKGFNIYDAIDECSDLLEQFGGHFYAAGMTLEIDKVSDFRMKFEEVVAARISKEQLIPEIEIDDEIDFRDIFENQNGGIPKFYRILKQFAPFGPDNMRPVFVTRNVRDSGYSKVLKDEHLKLYVMQEDYPEIKMNGIAFGLGDHFQLLTSGPVDIVYTLEENTWNGQTNLQLMVRDIRASKRPD